MAIDDLLDEHEQSERVRSWLRSNALGLIGGVGLGLAVISGWQWWQRDQANKNEQAHLAYQTANEQIGGGDLKKAEAAVASLGGNDQVYAELAGLQLAKAQVEAGERDAAIATLRAIKPYPALEPLVNQRLARLLIEAGKQDEALTLLQSASDAISLEVRGDALVAAGKLDEARTAYSQALTGMDVAAPQRRLLELKFSDIGGKLPDATGNAAGESA